MPNNLTDLPFFIKVFAVIIGDIGTEIKATFKSIFKFGLKSRETVSGIAKSKALNIPLY